MLRNVVPPFAGWQVVAAFRVKRIVDPVVGL
jgi:hypothetical protein